MNSVDVLWLIVFGAIGVNIGILPKHNEILESTGEWGIVFIMFALGCEENCTRIPSKSPNSPRLPSITAAFTVKPFYIISRNSI